MGVSLASQGLCNYLYYCVRLGKHRVVPEAEHLEAKSCEVVIPMGILGCLLNVLAAVYLDDEASFQANEINDVGANGSLTAELEAVDLTQAKVRPEFALRVCQATSERSRLLGSHTPHPSLPPPAGEGIRCTRTGVIQGSPAPLWTAPGQPSDRCVPPPP